MPLTPELKSKALDMLIAFFEKNNHDFAPKQKNLNIQEDLQAYVTKVEAELRPAAQSWFWFSSSDAERQDLLCAQYLLKRLNDGESVQDVFPNFDQIDENGFNLLAISEQLSDIRSQELKKIIENGIKIASEKTNTDLQKNSYK